jgi:PAS domain S-box-containing protein
MDGPHDGAPDILDFTGSGAPTSTDAWLSAIVSIAADAIISIDSSQRITLFNAGAEKIFGYRAAEILGEPLDLLLPDTLKGIHREHVRSFASSPVTARRMGERQSIVARRRSGEIFPADASISKVRVDDNWIFTVILRDATERRRTEDALQFLSQVGHELTLSLDLSDTIDRVARLTIPVLADACAIDVIDDDGSLATDTVAATDDEDAATLRELRIRRRSGTGSLLVEQLMRQRAEPLVLCPFSLDALRAYGLVPEVLHVILAERVSSLMVFPLSLRSPGTAFMSFFMTHSRREHDASYLALATALAGRVGHAIDNAQLYRKSQEAVAVRDEVVAIVSHDLRNPLSVVKMCASTLKEEPLPEAATIVELASTIHQSAEWMNTIIQDLLDVARLESGKLVMRAQPVSPAVMISDTVTFHQQLAQERGLSLVADVVENLPDVLVDAPRLSQVFANLIGNALKFTEANGVITVRAREQEGRVVISVADTGRGISAEDLPRLFDRFWQAQRGDLKRGTGLGLAIAKGIVEAHGGRIWVESSENSGATFSFSLMPA